MEINNDLNHNLQVPRCWIEKTIVAGRQDRLEGSHALGKALWSPQKSKDGKDIYHSMREVKPNDIVLHFIDNSAFVGVSKVKLSADPNFRGLPSTDWADMPGYRIELIDYSRLSSPIDRKEFLQNAQIRGTLEQILREHNGLFFNRKFELNQGAYLTEAPIELVEILNNVYLKKTGANLPYYDNKNIKASSVEVAKEAVIDAAPSPTITSHKPIAISSIVSSFHKGASNKAVGLHIKETLANNLTASLLAKRFLVLTGLAGSGKTKIAHAFAHWMSELQEQYRLVAVGADWTSNESILGYQDALQPTIYRKPASGALDLILKAERDPDRPYFLILDEMNLSHVERYFADILSAIESGQEIALHSSTETLGAFEGDPLPVPANIRLPENLFIIGTVNIDETTYMFSPKVLDRANVIEFRVSADEITSFLESPTKVNMDALAGKGAGYGSAFVNAARMDVSLAQLPIEIGDGVAAAVELQQRLTELFVELAPIGAEFGYRTAFEVTRFFYHHAVLTGKGWQFKDALDAQIVQKLMPKLHGSDRKLRPTLTKLQTFCETHDLELSLAKTKRMLERLTQDGFTSFAEA